jgi:Cdc6-like AAA superfamily ATPase
MPSKFGLIANAFQPGKEIDDPSRFAGRIDPLRQLVQALHSDGSCPIVYGDRGLGKSSLALQVHRIAMGDRRLLDDVGLADLAIPLGESFLAFYVPCTDETATKDDILRRVILSMESVAGRRSPDGVLVDRTTSREVSLRIARGTTTKNYKYQQDLDLDGISPEEKLQLLSERLMEQFDRGRVLIILDEVDRIADTTGLASYLKSFSTSAAKFMLVGISDSVTSLVSDHESIERVAVPIYIPRMSPQELGDIVDRAMSSLEANGVKMGFAPEAALSMSNASNGFPWFVHLLGQAGLMRAYNDSRPVVDEKDVERSQFDLANNRFAQQFSDKYHHAVRDSMKREIVLRALAAWRSRDIPVTDVYRILKEELGIANPATFKRDLCSDHCGNILLVPAFMDRGVTRFANEMFKVYVSMRPSLYGGVDRRVRDAYTAAGY